jgi:hypothetical protein
MEIIWRFGNLGDILSSSLPFVEAEATAEVAAEAARTHFGARRLESSSEMANLTSHVARFPCLAELQPSKACRNPKQYVYIV